MKRRPRAPEMQAMSVRRIASRAQGDLGLVLSGGGSRAAYQIGALRALVPYLKNGEDQIKVILGSSIGAINGLGLAACLKESLQDAVDELDALWRERTFRNTFAGTPSGAFIRAMKMAFVQALAPGPKATRDSVFDPTPLMKRVDDVLTRYGGLKVGVRNPNLKAVAVMTTVEGKQRKPLLFASCQAKIPDDNLRGAAFEVAYVESLTAKHGFASAALPSVLPPVEIDTEQGKVALVDGGISINVPVDPAVRLGAERVIVVDISGRSWWHDHYGEAHDKRPSWEVESPQDTFCLRPPDTFVVRPAKPFGPLLKDAVAQSTRKFIAALGPVWPVFTLLKQRLGEEVAYEAMTYVALDEDYIAGLLERGYQETLHLLENKSSLEFKRDQEIDELLHASA